MSHGSEGDYRPAALHRGGHLHCLAPSAFEWRKGDFLKPELVDAVTVGEDTVREVAAACPTRAIVLEEVIETLSG